MKEITMDDYQFLDSFKKKRIQLTLRTATYAGIVHRINLNKSVLLGDVVDVKSGRKFAGVKLFFGHEILNVELPNAPKPLQGNKEDYNHGTEGQLPVAEFQPYRKTIKLDADDDEGEYVDFVVIDGFYEKFGPAVMDIRKQQVIGIGTDGVGVSQHERLCWLQIATKTRVYLFDILLLGARAFKNGLSMILESNRILKVTHDCRGIAGCLWTQYEVNLRNVFDTQVADVMHFHTETGGLLPDRVSTLQEVVGLHLKMSPSCLASLKIKSQLTKEDREVWYVRPCPVSLLKVMALSVIHLQSLRMVLLDALMADYMDRVDSFLGLSREEPVDMQSIGTSSGLELPAELRELESLRRERREWAVASGPSERRATRSWDEPERPGPGEAGEGSPPVRPQASGEEGPSDVTPVRTSLDLPSSPRARPAGSPEVTQTPAKAAPAGGARPLEIAVAGAEGATGRGRPPQREAAPAAATCPPRRKRPVSSDTAARLQGASWSWEAPAYGAGGRCLPDPSPPSPTGSSSLPRGGRGSAAPGNSPRWEGGTHWNHAGEYSLLRKGFVLPETCQFFIPVYPLHEFLQEDLSVK
ncbi:hypothetical protein SKAU_G00338010 [Synaphobranchus kaupii]|uniref:3'-5' exonuclease domain-containing protein n=1 Tax=Synaphobranchus kaupii TaxID=118154 RepID=A0A9Q1EMD6_SYNKA|nr:hypothetical protein SKAU_G00338010 [Synaphobranchus kaupii]